MATILQPDYDLAQYPNDNQDVVMSFESYAYTQSVMSLHFQQDPIGYISDSEGRIVLSKNPVSKSFEMRSHHQLMNSLYVGI